MRIRHQLGFDGPRRRLLYLQAEEMAASRNECGGTNDRRRPWAPADVVLEWAEEGRKAMLGRSDRSDHSTRAAKRDKQARLGIGAKLGVIRGDIVRAMMLLNQGRLDAVKEYLCAAEANRAALEKIVFSAVSWAYQAGYRAGRKAVE